MNSPSSTLANWNLLLSSYNNIIVLFGGLIALCAVIAALYLGSSFHEGRKQKKLKRVCFKQRVQEQIYPAMMSAYQKYLYERNGTPFLNHIRWNSVQVPLEKNYSTDFKHHKDELEFFEFLREQNIVVVHSYPSETLNPPAFINYIYTMFPTLSSWKYIVNQYNQTSYKKNQDKWAKQLADLLYVPNRQRRNFLKKFLSFLKD